MSSIDERIVEMKFNNAQFERNASQSKKTLQDLKSGLNLDGSKKSLEGLAAAAKNFSVQSIADGVQTMASKFTALGIVGVTALANIANRAVDTGLQLVKSLTIAPIKSGFD